MVSFMRDQKVMLMLKLGGLTVKLTYESGRLQEAATRGDGEEGEIITHNAAGINGVPAVGSVRLLDAAACKERRVTYMPFGVLEGVDELETKAEKLHQLSALGFEICKFMVSNSLLSTEEMDGGIQTLRTFAEENDIPIAGVAISYNDIAFSKACGRTGHHYKDDLAFKFEDDLFETVLRSIEWTPTRSGEIAPVAVFDTVEIDGRAVSRASLHNLSFIEGLELVPGYRVLVSKRNMIILHIEENLDRGGFALEEVVPTVCPCCGEPTRVHSATATVEGGERVTKTLFCDNANGLWQFVHFVRKKGDGY